MLRGALIVAVGITPIGVEAEPRVPGAKPLADAALTASSGLASFIDPQLRSIAGVGEAWSVRVAAGRPRGIRLEVAYTGSTQPLDASEGSRLTGYGGQATMRINFAPGQEPLEPFLYFGAGWMHFHATLSPESRLRPDDDVFVMPLGLGLARTFGSFVLEVRGGVDVTSGGALLAVNAPSSSHDAASMHRFGLIAGVGYRL